MGNICCSSKQDDPVALDFQRTRTLDSMIHQKLLVTLKTPQGVRGTKKAESLMNTMRENWELIQSRFISQSPEE